jgi:hypothetical protein
MSGADVFRDPVVELYAGGDWQDVTGDVRYRGGIVIDRGRGGEDETTPPQTCRVTLDDRNGDYNPRNPNGVYYGSIGRNTPLRVALCLASTGFGTPAVNGWGSTDTVDGQEVFSWATFDGVPADYAVAAGVATHALSAAGQARISYLPAVFQSDVEVRITVTVPTSDVTGTGGIAAANLIIHGKATNNFYLLRLVIQPDETVTVDFWNATPASITGGAAVTIPGLVHSAGQPLRVAFGCEGRALRAKVWPAAGVEPYGWHKTFVDEDLTAARPTLVGQPGWVGVRSSLVGGNTNGPITLSYDDFELRHPRFAGEVSTWPPTRDTSGADLTVTVTASGLKRRAAQGSSPLDSPLRRQLTGVPGVTTPLPVGYWPLEDRLRAVAGEVLAVRGHGNLTFVAPSTGTTAGKVAWANDTTLPGSDALPTLSGGGSLVAYLNPVGNAAAWYVTWCTRWNSTDGAYAMFSTRGDLIQLALIIDPATTPTVLNVYLTTPSLSLGILVHDFVTRESVESWHFLGLYAEQRGAAVDFFLLVDGEVVDIHTESPLKLTELYQVQLSSPPSTTGGASVGHVASFDVVPDQAGMFDAFSGNPNETAGQRMYRLCLEESVFLAWVGAFEVGVFPPVAGDTPRVGVQQVQTLLTLLEDAAVVDQGLLFEQRAVIGYHYRSRRSLYTQPAAVTLDYSAGEIAPEWRPVDDDRYTRNEVTATRVDGGSYRHEVTTGRLSVADVEDGGAGRYRDSITVNASTDAQLRGIAEWRAHLGTVEEDRYPAVNLQLHGHGLRTNLAKLAALLDLDLGDRVVITGLADTGVPDDANQLAIGYSEYLTPFEHELSLVCAPASPYRVARLNDTTYSTLGSAAWTLGEDLDLTETGVDVVAAAGAALWTTTPPHAFDIVVGGEVMTVTAVSGTASPQTLTVTRAVNGIHKTHATGAAVRLARTNYIGL